jgi:hypothetical protein
MKISSAVFAVLLLAATVAVGEQHASYAEPFPQSANPALANGAAEEASTAVTADMPSSMSTNQDWRGNADLGSPFPQAGNPSLGRTGEEMSPDNTIDLGSPFPSTANPSNR